ARRRQREQKAASGEADGKLSGSSGGALLAAVHEEVQRLPAALRTAFVLCDLEGVQQPAAAAQLAWKLGTLTGRLTRARQRILDGLTRRGLAPAAVGGAVGFGVATAAARPGIQLIDTTMSLIRSGGNVPPAILQLVREVIPMATFKMKLAAAVVAAAAGLSATLFPLASAQSPGVGGPPGAADAFQPPRNNPQPQPGEFPPDFRPPQPTQPGAGIRGGKLS